MSDQTELLKPRSDEMPMGAAIAADPMMAVAEKAEKMPDHEKGHDAKEAHAKIDRAWEKGFKDRNGEKLKIAMEAAKKDPKALSDFLKTQKVESAVEAQPVIRIRCIEDRMLLPGYGNGGSGTVLATPDGKGVRVPTVDEMAKNILESDAVKNSMSDIEICMHRKCGACGIALALMKGLKPEELRAEQVDIFARARGAALTSEIERRLGPDSKRKVTFTEAPLDDKSMQNLPEGHPAQVIYVTDFKGDFALNPNFAGLPQGMHLHPDAFNRREDFNLHLKTALAILGGGHGPHKEPLLIIGLTNKEGGAASVQGKIDAALLGLPEEARKKILTRSAVIATSEKSTDK